MNSFAASYPCQQDVSFKGSVKLAVDSDSYWGNAMIGMYRGKRKVVLLYS